MTNLDFSIPLTSVFTVTETCSEQTGARQNCPASMGKSKVNLARMDVIILP